MKHKVLNQCIRKISISKRFQFNAELRFEFDFPGKVKGKFYLQCVRNILDMIALVYKVWVTFAKSLILILLLLHAEMV